MTLYSELMGDHMTCNDIITAKKYAHTTTITVMREGERVRTLFLGLAGMEWGTAVARRPDWV